VAVVGPKGSVQSATARLVEAGLLADRGETAPALAAAQRAVEDAGIIGPLGYVSLASVERLQLRLGHAREAAMVHGTLEERRKQLPSESLQRLLEHQQSGLLAHDRHDAAMAIRELKQAEELARPGASNTPLIYELATAYLDAHDDGEAARRFERIVASGVLRAGDPLPYVRSLYFLGQVSDRKGDRAKAAGYYKQFLQYWGDGDLDRDRVADARKKLAGS